MSFWERPSVLVLGIWWEWPLWRSSHCLAPRRKRASDLLL
jgi:hypothetical protein